MFCDLFIYDTFHNSYFYPYYFSFLILPCSFSQFVVLTFFSVIFFFFFLIFLSFSTFIFFPLFWPRSGSLFSPDLQYLIVSPHPLLFFPCILSLFSLIFTFSSFISFIVSLITKAYFLFNKSFI